MSESARAIRVLETLGHGRSNIALEPSALELTLSAAAQRETLAGQRTKKYKFKFHSDSDSIQIKSHGRNELGPGGCGQGSNSSRVTEPVAATGYARAAARQSPTGGLLRTPSPGAPWPARPRARSRSRASFDRDRPASRGRAAFWVLRAVVHARASSVLRAHSTNRLTPRWSRRRHANMVEMQPVLNRFLGVGLRRSGPPEHRVQSQSSSSTDWVRERLSTG